MATPSRQGLTFWRGIFFVLVALGLGATFVRFSQGLGAVTNLSDRFPWGLWKAFNVLVAIGLGGAGFTLMAIVHVFNVKRWQPVVRPVVVMAFLAYLSASISLFFDIGKSWAIWHPIFMWNPNSVLFEVAWCLMLYTCVLTLEGSGILFEKLGWHKAAHMQHVLTLPIVIAGVILSTLHQSSLGTLFLIVPGKLHALWYTPVLPILFFVSAIGAGLAMILLMYRLASRAFQRRLDLPLLVSVGRALTAVLGVYGVIRLYDLVSRGALGRAFDGSYESFLFLAEFGLYVLVPFTMLHFSRVRQSAGGLYAAAVSVVAGFILNRLNVSITGLEAAQGGTYVPSWAEAFMTLMIVALAIAGFRLAVRYLPIFPDEAPVGYVPSASRSTEAPAPAVDAWGDALPVSFGESVGVPARRLPR